MSEERATNPDAPEEADAHLPPLRIHHFMLWTAVAATTAALHETLFRGFSAYRILILADYFGAVLPGALAASMLTLGICWLLRGFTFFCEIGHWLVTVVTLGFLSNLMASIYVYALLHGSYDSKYYDVYNWCLSLFSLGITIAVTLLYFVMAWNFDKQVHWRRFFMVAGFCHLVHLLWYALYHTTNSLWGHATGERELVMVLSGICAPTLWCLFCCVAITSDLRRQVSHHWSSWLGILLWLLCTLSNVTTAVYQQFLAQ